MSLSSRLRQLGLIAFAFALGFLAMFQMFQRVNGQVPSSYLLYFAATAVLVLLVFAVTLRFQPHADLTMLSIVVLLALLGITMIARIDWETSGAPGVIGERQFMWLVFGLGIGVLLLVFLKDYRTLRRFSYVCMVIGLALLFSPMIPGLGRTLNGARAWIGIGSHTVQPSEFAKIFLAVFFASYLFDHRDQLAVAGPKVLGVRLPRLRDLAPIAVVFAVSMLTLVLQRDLGTGLMFFAMFVCMLYLATGQRFWVYLGVILFFGAAFVASRMFDHVRARFEMWLSPLDPAIYNRSVGGSWQLVNGMFGMAHGGLLGTGLGQGRPGLTAYANSDFIYTSLGEELGLTGAMAILMLYLTLITAGVLVALRVRDEFGKLLAGGLMFSMAFQVFVVVGGVTCVIPLTGLTLPFMAAGGSSMIANLILVFLVLIISNQANRPDTDTRDAEFQRKAREALDNARREAAAAGRRGREARAQRPAASRRPAPEYEDEPSIPRTSMQPAVRADDEGIDPALLDLGFDYDEYEAIERGEDPGKAGKRKEDGER